MSAPTTLLATGSAGSASVRCSRDVRRVLVPNAFVLANAIAFYLVRPGVPDLWAARARASAAGHGVGLTYWFSWFGGVTPGNYSVVTPYLCTVFGTELVAGAAAVAIGATVTMLLRGTPRPLAAAGVASLCIVLNLWCGRVPFLVGTAFGVATLVFVQRRRSLPAAVLAVLSVLASPVSGVFLCLGMSGVLLTPRLRSYRVPAAVAVAATASALIVLAVLFGTPGPEPFPLHLLIEIGLVFGLLLCTAPPDQLRSTLLISALATLVTFTFPNGLGSNVARLALFCLPPAVVALSRRRVRTLTAVLVPVLLLSALSSVSAWTSAAEPDSTVPYYAPLITELDRLPTLRNHRLEVVNAAHAAYAVLLGHAILARGWETQEDAARNAILTSNALDASSYRRWLDDNAVGYIAFGLPSSAQPEARVVSSGRPHYLHEIWSSSHWRLYAVRDPAPIVATPAVLEASSQSAMTVRVPCACRTSIRIRWSRFLGVSPRLPPETPDPEVDLYRPALVPAGGGWTTLTTNRPGTYVLDGSP